MKRQLSTAMSDLVLALSAIWGFRMLHDNPSAEHQYGKWWFMLMTLAATLGVVRFGALFPRYQSSVLRYHTNFSWLCRALGVPCLAAEVCNVYQLPVLSRGFLMSAVATFLASSLKSRHKDHVTDLVNIASVLTILGLSVTGGNNLLAAASVLFIISGIVGSEGDIQLISMSRVDVLHYTLVAINYCIAWGLIEKV
ncbi:uncharacterized protein [Panulirus ornatus]|uniref:uncharacterized protein n=1 Tax=Panulirus ornatus TaxID=150431 RepID=UPI003A85DC40